MVGKWLKEWKPIHLCWWFEKHGWKVPKYLIGGAAQHEQFGFRICTAPGDNADPDNVGDHTWAATNTDVNGIEKETPFFVRLGILNSVAGSADATWNFTYRATADDSSDTTALTTTSNVVRIVNDPENAITDGAVTDDNLIADAHSEDGAYIDASDVTAKLDLAQNAWMEIQVCLQFQSDASHSTDYFFYAQRFGSELDTYDEVPKITTAAAGSSPSTSPSASISSSISSSASAAAGFPHSQCIIIS